MGYKNPNDPRALESRRKHYRENREQYYANNRAKKQRMKEYIDSVKSAPCADCGIAYPPYVMDFDHRDPADKVIEVSKMRQRAGWAKLREEIAKCDVVCANCHRIRTHERQLNGL